MALLNLAINSAFTDVPTGLAFESGTVVTKSIVILPGVGIRITFDLFAPGGTVAAIRNRQIFFTLTNPAFGGAGLDVSALATALGSLISGAVTNAYTPDSIVT